MLHEGLHIGIAAWIDAQRDDPGFVTWPALPFATRLVDLEAVQTAGDLARAAEFSRTVNFVPRKGRFADPFVAGEVLWEVHRSLLERMEFAERAWTPQEDEQWRAARAVLYEEADHGVPVPTRAFRLYDELRIAHADLIAAGADPAELASAMADWVVVGDKLRVEAALSTVVRFARRSSLPEAEEERLVLEPHRLPASVDGSYAETAFAPVSAVRGESWLTAEATVDELERAIGDGAPRGPWEAWRSARSGSVRFDYTVLDVRRPWFSLDLYAADDWRLDDGAVVAEGDGVNGVVPAFVRCAYLARAVEVRTAPPASSDPPVTPPLRPPLRPGVGWPQPRPGTGPWPSAAPALGVVTVVPPRAPALASPVVVHHLAPQVRSLGADFRAARFGRLERFTLGRASDRAFLAQQLLSSGGGVPPVPVPTGGEVQVVGFGCTALPAAPRPNPGYRWTSH